MNNIPKWDSKKIKEFYSNNRIHWDQLYNSQKEILEKANLQRNSSILDLGCACGGLYKILNEKFGINEYIGIDINSQCIQYAKQIYKNVEFIANDVSNMNDERFLGKFDFVISFGFIDCSNSFYETFEKITKYLKPDGKLIFDLRITDKEGILDINKSYQYLDYSGENDGEKIPYNVININNFSEYLKRKFKNFDCHSTGYKLAPAKNAVLKYNEIGFSTWLLKLNGDNKRKINLPYNLQI